MEFAVRHDTNSRQFYVELEDKAGNEVCEQHKAVLDYKYISEGVIDLYHTEVPPKFRGKGVAQLLAKTAMDFAVDKNLKMVLSCTYLQKYSKDINPQVKYTERIIQS